MAACPLSKESKTPRIYKEAARILEVLENKQGGLKDLVFNSKYKVKPVLYALICNILKHRELLNYIINDTKIHEEPNVKPNLLRVLIYEHLVNEKPLIGDANTTVCVRKKRLSLGIALTKYNAEKKATPTPVTEKAAVLAKVPRYVRVNTLKTTLAEVLKLIIKEGFEQVNYDADISYESFIELAKNLSEKEFLCDMHVENLLLFHPQSNFIKHHLYLSGKIMLQDKSSCLPVLLLKPTPGSVVLDACAAVGMKTTHMAAFMKNQGTILANDYEPNRVKVMIDILKNANVQCVTTKVSDFSKVNPEEKPFSDVKYILLDPSCSGSGIVQRYIWDDEGSSADNEARLQNLSKFQLILLLKALSFPKVERVVYSTCSVHRAENELVVKKALRRYSYVFKLVTLPPKWPFRSTDTSTATSHWYACRCLRTISERDLANGFFVAVFERKTDEDREVVGMNVAREDESAKSHQESPKKSIEEKKRLKSVTEADDSKNLPAKKKRKITKKGKSLPAPKNEIVAEEKTSKEVISKSGKNNEKNASSGSEIKKSKKKLKAVSELEEILQNNKESGKESKKKSHLKRKSKLLMKLSPHPKQLPVKSMNPMLSPKSQ